MTSSTGSRRSNMPTGVYVRNKEHGRRIGESLRGKMPKNLKRLHQCLKGRKLSEEHVRKIVLRSTGRTGEKAAHWKGDKVGYWGLHDWVKKRLGQPDTCEHCGKNGLGGLQIHWANKSQEYKRDLSDWLRLCAKCHKGYDHKLKKSHELPAKR